MNRRAVVTRRAVLGRLALVGGGALVAACSPPPPAGSVASAPTATQAVAKTTAPATLAPVAASRVVFGPANEPGGLNPLLPDTGSSGASWELLFEGLVVPDPRTGAPSPSLAETWEASADGLTWTFHLRPGVRWSDGQLFTSEDARFTFDTILDPKMGSPRRGALANIAAYDAIDPGTFRVTLKQPDCPFLVNTMAMPIVPKHALSGVTDMKTDDFNSRRPVGTGPFVFKSGSVGSR